MARVKTSKGGVVSDRQHETLLFIRRYIQDYGRAPTLREIAAASDCSAMSARYRIRELASAGLLTYERYKSRSVRLVG